MGRAGVDLNLQLDPSPPKQHKIEVRVLTDVGSMWFRDGEVHLAARSTHLLWRDEAQALIAEGLVEKVSD
jgi:GINS complex subunit 1